MKSALIIGSQGTIGTALVDNLQGAYLVTEINQSNCSYQEDELEAYASKFAETDGFDLIICCIGALHNERIAPEKRLRDLKAGVLQEYFRINVVLPALCLRYFVPLLKKQDQTSVYISLSAMVGSIGENALGGWYGYRSSKAGLNMLLKTASRELRHSHRNSAILAVHPGTTKGDLSLPYAGRVDPKKYYSPKQTAERIVSIAESVTAQDSGKFLNWDGREIAW